MIEFTLISFYTPDWEYPVYANNLRADCERLRMKYHIIEKPSTNSYVGNCQIKAFFIRDTLESLKSPVLWMDADGSILKKPELLYEDRMVEYDIAGNHPVDAQHRVHVGSIWFNYTDASRRFIDTWCTGIEKKNPLDDAAFNGTWDIMKNEVRFLPLPESYFFIHKDLMRPIPNDVLILHRLSRSQLKQQYKRDTESR